MHAAHQPQCCRKHLPGCGGCPTCGCKARLLTAVLVAVVHCAALVHSHKAERKLVAKNSLRDCTFVPHADRDAASGASEPGRGAAGKEIATAQAGASSAASLPARPGVGRCRYTRLPRLVKASCLACWLGFRLLKVFPGNT